MRTIGELVAELMEQLAAQRKERKQCTSRCQQQQKA